MHISDYICCCLPKFPKYADHTWDELPDDAKEAAAVLGYTKKLWDKKRTPEPIDDRDWEDLTLEQQAAAIVLGYDQYMWDNADE